MLSFSSNPINLCNKRPGTTSSSSVVSSLSTMKTPYSVIFLVLSTSWIATANKTVIPTVLEETGNTTEPATGAPLTMGLTVEKNSESKEASFTDEELEEALLRELEDENEIELEIRTTKNPKEPQTQNNHLATRHNHLHYTPQSGPMPYYAAPVPMPYAMPYSQCPFSLPMPNYYPMPMYPPYPFPGFNPNQFTSPPNVIKTVDPTDTTEVVNVEKLKFAKIWNVAKNITVANTTVATKPPKRLIISNWIKNKAIRKSTKTPLTKKQQPVEI